MSNFLVNRVLEKCSIHPSDRQINDLNKLYQDHVNKKICVHNKYDLFAKQINFGIEDIYDRFYKILIEGKPKDSSSLKSFVLKYGEVKGKELFEEKISKTKSTLDSFIEKYGPVVGEDKYKKYCIKKSASIEGFIARYGDIVGTQKHKEYWENTGFTTSKDQLVKRYGEYEGKERYKNVCDKISKANLLDSYIEKYGEDEGKERYSDRYKRSSINSGKEVLVKRMIKDGCSIDDILLAISDRWSRGIESYQRKYGEDKGKERYNTWKTNAALANPTRIEYYRNKGISDKESFEIISDIQISRNTKPSCHRASKESLCVLLPVIKELESVCGTSCLYDNSEYFIRLNRDEFRASDSRMFFYDFTFLDLSLIIEYHGVLYHDDVDYYDTKNMVFGDFVNNYNKDLFKKWVAEERGYDVIVIRSWHKYEDMKTLYNYLVERGINICQSKFI